MALVKPQSEKEPNSVTGFYHPVPNIEDFIICKSPDKLMELVASIELHNAVQYVSDGDWSTHNLVMELLKKYSPADIWFTTYAIRELPVRQLILAQEAGKIKSINMLLDYRARARTPEVFQLANQNANKIGLAEIHAKVTVIQSDAGCISIVGSANWTTNPKIECGTIVKSKEAAAFHTDWINKLMDNAEIFD